MSAYAWIVCTGTFFCTIMGQLCCQRERCSGAFGLTALFWKLHSFSALFFIYIASLPSGGGGKEGGRRTSTNIFIYSFIVYSNSFFKTIYKPFDKIISVPGLLPNFKHSRQ